AVDWIKEREFTNNKHIVVYGISKGAELALLAASKNSNIKGVVAMAPTSHVLEGYGTKKQSSSWSQNGQELPFVPSSTGVKRLMKSLFNSKDKYCNKDMVQAIEKYEKKGKTEALIKVENIKGPILLLSGDHD
ncbi:acyl-CoA thioester hydrolase/BAAT C-terminal domain-containing protein, partial [Pseudomonas sp. 2995-1]|uniref:acyl-CoA thioester hydrolase/BAAT C-terminal domain-containing protein n=1 Tax=Pseudomonas sp. 2995-1 TaxID=1712679 RepID=UPI001C489232